jgi:arylsulfatase A-like enzyme
MDMLPTLASVAHTPIEHEVDGMDLSHNLFNTAGKDREHYFMAFEGGCYFVRDKRFRLHEDGRFYDVPVTGNETRYSMELSDEVEQNKEVRADLQRRLDEFMKIKQTDTSYEIIPFGTNGDNFKNAQQKRSKKPRTNRPN